MKAGQGVEQSLADILSAREERANWQKRFLAEYQSPLINFKLNIPGNVKDSDMYRAIFREGMSSLLLSLAEHELPVLAESAMLKASGPEGLIAVATCPERLKELTVALEESHLLGRIFDLDVLALDGTQVSRSDLGLGPRKCFLCAEDAFVCSRSRRHSLPEMLQYIERVWVQFSEAKNSEVHYTQLTRGLF